MLDVDTKAGYDLVVAAPWLPVHADPLRWSDGAGSTARVLRAAVAAHGGAWVGATTISPDDVALLDQVWLYPVRLDAGTAEDYLHGHCAATLSPLYHDNGPAPVFEPHWRAAYGQVNHLVARRVAAVAAPHATVWVHDYHLQLVPGHLRDLRPDVRIGFFLHSPFPSRERFTTQPLRERIVASLNAADLLGFQDSRSASNFIDAAAAIGVPASRGRPHVGTFPASIDVAAIEALTRDPRVRRDAAAIRSDLGNPRAVLLSIGAPEHADASHRLLDAYAHLLADGRVDPDDTVLVHVAVCGDDPTHLRCDRPRLDRAVARINGTHGRVGRPPVHYLHREQSLHDIVALYLTADVMLALPLRDGMTLAAKEYLATRITSTGRLVLSEFSGAAAQLPQANLVNPYDIDAVQAAILAAISDCHYASGEIAAMRQHLTHHDAVEWTNRFLTALTRDAVGETGSIGAAR